MGRKMLHSSGASVASSSTKKKKKKKKKSKSSDASAAGSSLGPPPMESVDSVGLSAMTDDFSRVSGGTNSVHTKKNKKKKAAAAAAAAAGGDGGAPPSSASVGSNEKLQRALQHMASSQSGEKEQIDFLQDPKEQMTYGRRIALALQHQGWYNVNECRWRRELEESSDEEDDEDEDDEDDDDDEDGKKKKQDQKEQAKTEDETKEADDMDESGRLSRSESKQSILDQLSLIETRPPKESRKEYPILAKAWAYFEHSTLPRYIVEEDEDDEDNKKAGVPQELSRAEPGEDDDPTLLYDPIKTHISQMGDFGLGMGLYFWTLRSLAVLCFLAGVLSLPNILYYSSDAYSSYQPGVPLLLRGSAVCTDVQFVPCPNCTESNFQKERFAYAVVQQGQTNITLPFALKNNCEGATLQNGMISFGALFLMILGVGWMSYQQQKQEVEFDEDEQTAQDYSIHIKNPPPDAYDPQEWRDFFKKEFNGAHATSITVAIDNDLLVRSLAERRDALKKLELLVEPGTKLDTLSLAKIAAEVERNRGGVGDLIGKVAPGVPDLFTKVAALEAKIEGLAQLDYSVTNVFVSFEYEHDQRAVLAGLSISDWERRRQKPQAWSIIFREDVLLQAGEPEEPNTLVWENLNVSSINLLKTLSFTTVSALLAILLIALLINFLHTRESSSVAAIAISITNGIFPQVAKFLTSFERHSTEGDKQTSLYFKINVFRWVNTAIVITIITPFSRTLSNGGLLQSIYAIFLAEVTTSNGIQLGDPTGHLQRHFLAPRAKTQDLMNLNFRGTDFELAERYTNMTKLLFLCLWYNALYPGCFFITAFALYLTYYVDRFSLMRTWRRKPMLGTTIARFSRRYFFSVAVMAMAIVTAYYWAGFPFDDLCANNDTVNTTYIGDFNLTTVKGTSEVATIDAASSTYRFCPQYVISNDERQTFPPNPSSQPPGAEWMTEDQELVVSLYGWASLGVMALVCWSLLFGCVKGIEGFFRASYNPAGEDQGIPFSGVKSISTYVPQVESNVHSYPLLACSIDGIDPELFDWTDPSRPHGYYDLTKDCEELIGKEKLEGRHVFSILSHEPPPNPFMDAEG